MTPTVPNRSSTVAWALLALVALNFALQVNVGMFAPSALAALGVSLAFSLVAIAAVPVPAVFSDSGFVALAGAAVLSQYLLLLRVAPTLYVAPDWHGPDSLFDLLTLALVIVGVLGLVTRAGRRPRVIVGFVALLFVGASAWAFRRSPEPFADTFVVHRDGAAALLAGRNPFAITFPNIYGPGTPFYPASWVSNGRVLFGYPYPPLSLLMALPGYVVTHDPRWSMVAALAMAAVLLAWANPGRAAVAGATLMLSATGVYWVVESCCTEPLIVLLTAVVIWTVVRRPGWTAAAFGLLLASKQHMVLLAPAGLWLLPRPLGWRDVLRFYAVAFAAALAVTLPFVLWDPRAFWRSCVAIHLALAPRADSLSFATLLLRHGIRPPRFVSGLLVLGVYALAWRRMPAGPRGFVLTAAGVFLVFLAFDQAFIGRLYLVQALLCCAVAASQAGEDEQYSVSPLTT